MLKIEVRSSAAAKDGPTQLLRQRSAEPMTQLLAFPLSSAPLSAEPATVIVRPSQQVRLARPDPRAVEPQSANSSGPDSEPSYAQPATRERTAKRRKALRIGGAAVCAALLCVVGRWGGVQTTETQPPAASVPTPQGVDAAKAALALHDPSRAAEDLVAGQREEPKRTTAEERVGREDFAREEQTSHEAGADDHVAQLELEAVSALFANDRQGARSYYEALVRIAPRVSTYRAMAQALASTQAEAGYDCQGEGLCQGAR